LLNRASLI